MRLRHALAGVPPLVLLCSAVVLAWDADALASHPPAIASGIDVGRARASLMSTTPVGTPIEAALVGLRGQSLSCTTSEPLLANLTWRVVECSTAPSPFGRTLQIDVAGRNGVVADIGVEDRSCLSRADVTDPTPAPLDCDISSKRLLDVEARRRAAAGALLAEVLGSPASVPKPHR